MTFYKQLIKYKGRKVEIYTFENNSSSMEAGIITNIVTSLGDNGIFVMLDDNKLINIRYIIKIIVKD
jgi:hypothetical protein